MPDDTNQRAVFEFLSNHFQSQKSFTIEDLRAVTTWIPNTFRTYWSKQFRELTVPVDSSRYRVGESFRPYATWDRFRDHVTQMRRVSADYTSIAYDSLMMFEFFMPLTNEGQLRTVLDALFYRDSILARLRTVDLSELEEHFARLDDEHADSYLGRVCDWVADRFGGYSITHVNGRFRASEVLSLRAAAELQERGGRYLIDETTAIVRFIFPVANQN